MWKLFIDDERFPVNEEEFIVARSLSDVVLLVKTKGMPSFISFDHDLGENMPTGLDIAWWLIEHDLDNDSLPTDFDFYVHSQNPVGAANIKGLLRGYLEKR